LARSTQGQEKGKRTTMQARLRFLGAAQNVTGSRYLLESDRSRLLVDCGLYQERQYADRNWVPLPIDPKELDAVLLTHAHLDHVGYLPRLVKQGFSGPVYCTEATAEIAQIVLMDAAHLQEEDAEFKRRRHEREGRKGPHGDQPLYEKADAEACEPLYRPVTYNQRVQVSPNVTAAFHDSGHILGAATIELCVREGDEKRTILFSGDVGRADKPILNDPVLLEKADYLVIESTYGDRVHEPTANVKNRLAQVINETYKRGGNILIPAFAIERSQEILYYLSELLHEDRIPHLLAFLDSPMAVKVTEVFKAHPELYDEEMSELVSRGQSPFDFPGLTMSRTTAQSKAINHIRGTAIVIAGSGMCTGGRIKHHLVNNITRRESTLLFVGYQAVGTLGRIILDGADEVRILGQKYPVKAKVERIHGFSAHADRDELTVWAKSIKPSPRHVFVTHGEPDAAQALAKHLVEVNGFTTSAPTYNEVVALS